MSDVSIEVSAQDMASKVLNNIAKESDVMAKSVSKMSKDVTKGTKDISNSMKDASSSMRRAKDDVSGITGGFSSLTKSLFQIVSVAALMKAAFAGFNFMSKSLTAFIDAGSPAGQALGQSFARVNEAMEKVQQTVGAALAPAAKLAADAIGSILMVVNEGLKPAIGFIQLAFEQLAPRFEAFKIRVIAAISAVEVIFANLGQVFELAKLSLALRIESITENIKHGFTVVMPAYIKWFADNALNMVRDAAMAIATVITNLGTNLGEFGAAVYDWISSGMAGGVEGLTNRLGQSMMVGLMDGFEAKTQALPEIAARAMTATEQELALQIGTIGGDLGSQFTAKFQERLQDAKLGMPMPDMGQGHPKAFGVEETADLGKSLSSVADSQSQIAQQLSATESRLLTRGPSEGPMGTIAEATKKTAEAAEKTVASSDRMVDLLEQLLAKNFIVAEAV